MNCKQSTICSEMTVLGESSEIKPLNSFESLVYEGVTYSNENDRIRREKRKDGEQGKTMRLKISNWRKL